MPVVSIIIPCYNEASTIRLLLEAVYAQTYPREDMEVVIADGQSTDGTRAEVSAFEAGHPDLLLRVVDNPRRSIPAALNRAIQAARGEYLLRLDAHCVPQPDYVERSLAALRQGLGDNVGGVWLIRPGGEGWMARAIALTAAHPLGVGDARYRYATQAGLADTVPFGAFSVELIRRIGPFDETLLTNEDYEFNTRIRQSGGRVWLDPAIRSVYFARPHLGALVRQYGRYGFWKLRMLRRYPKTLRWRQALPPLFVASLIGLALLSIWFAPVRWLLSAEIAVYLLILVAAGLLAAWQKKDWAYLPGVPLAIAAMHLAWGGGFLWSLVNREK